MKKITILLLSVLLFASFYYGRGRYYSYTPVFLERAELEKSVTYESSPRELMNPGKIYYNDSYIYVNERYKGVHVINNSNPASPVNEGFIVVPGCVDIAAKGNTLYLDNSVDMIAFDLKAKQVTERIRNVFPEPLSPNGEYFYDYNRPEGLILVEWKQAENNK
ncbi:hypothetical protein LJC35_03080 [Parabacteroides sp. OttesenSCG-928-N08]|nr:hypothetical protein [Parabacteroides sp. OttesenSCG-928-N08]